MISKIRNIYNGIKKLISSLKLAFASGNTQDMSSLDCVDDKNVKSIKEL